MLQTKNKIIETIYFFQDFINGPPRDIQEQENVACIPHPVRVLSVEGKSCHPDCEGVGDARRTEAQAVRCTRQAASIAAQSRSFFSGATVFHISGSCAAVLALQTQRRLQSSSPNISVGKTACLVGAGSGPGACI